MLFACEAFATFDEFLEAPCACSYTDADETFIESLLGEASDVLYLISGGKVTGRCTRTIRPCRSDCSCGRSYGCCGTGACCWVDTVPLRGPNTEVLSVRIDGAYLDVASYGLMDGNLLYRRSSDGTRPDNWPGCQKLYLEPSEEGTFEIVFRFGWPGGELAKQAAIELACRWGANYDSDKQRAKLPAGAVGANVGGVQMQLRRQAGEVKKEGGAGAGMSAVEEFLGVWVPQGMLNTGVYAPELDECGWEYHATEGPSGS